jgi:hypothetical protein
MEFNFNFHIQTELSKPGLGKEKGFEEKVSKRLSIVFSPFSLLAH